MRCRVAYRIGEPPGWLTRRLTGMLSIDDGGVRIEGPVPYRADCADIRALDVTNRPGGFFIAIRFQSSPPLFVTPFLFSFLGFVQFIDPRLNESVYTELSRRLPETGRSPGSAPEVGTPRASRWPGLLALAAVLALFDGYVGSYYHLSRRGMREAKVYGMKGFLYVPAQQPFAERDLSRHDTLARLYAPLNLVDRALFGADGPGGGFTWGLSKD
jgi:hypothetical protein